MVEQQHRPWHNAGISKILDNDGWKSNTGTSHQGFGNSNHFRERQFSAACCIKGYHINNWTEWTAEIGSILTSKPEKRPGALVEDKCAIAIISNNQTVGHFPKFLPKLTFFFLKHRATLTVKVTRKRRNSFDLPQGGMEIPAEFICKSEKKELFDQIKEKTLEEIRKYDKRRKKGMENSLEKKENKNKK